MINLEDYSQYDGIFSAMAIGLFIIHSSGDDKDWISSFCPLN